MCIFGHLLRAESLDGFVYHNAVWNQFNVYSIYQQGIYLALSVGECWHSNCLMYVLCKQRWKGTAGQDAPLTHSAALLRSAFDPETLCPLRPPARSARCQAGTSGKSAGPTGKTADSTQNHTLVKMFCIILLHYLSICSHYKVHLFPDGLAYLAPNCITGL